LGVIGRLGVGGSVYVYVYLLIFVASAASRRSYAYLGSGIEGETYVRRKNPLLSALPYDASYLSRSIFKFDTLRLFALFFRRPLAPIILPDCQGGKTRLYEYSTTCLPLATVLIHIKATTFTKRASPRERQQKTPVYASGGLFSSKSTL